MKNIAIFASGSGTNAENIAKTFAGGNRIRVTVAVTDRQDAGVVGRMEALGIPVLFFPGKIWREEPEKIVEALRPYNIDLVALAGFMRKVADPIIEAWDGMMLNIHPSLLPAYGGKGMYGHHVHEAVIAAGEKQSGVTVHKVSSELDKGEIVMQGILDIEEGETPESLEAKIHEIEYEIYPRAIAKILRDADKNSRSKEVKTPGVSESATPDEQWAQALHMAYTPPKVEEHITETPPPLREQGPSPVCATSSFTSPVSQPAGASQQCPSGMPSATIKEEGVKEMEPANSYLIFSIIFIVLFSLIPAVIGLFYSFKTRRLNSYGDFLGAHKASRVCQGWLIASFCLGILQITFFLPLAMASMSLAL